MAMPAQHRRKPVIGLVGGIGSGKTLVAGQLASLGGAVIDADAIAQSILDEIAIRDQLVRWWGAGILDKQGNIDRRKVGDIAFSNPTELEKLERLIHPKVLAERDRLTKQYQEAPEVKAIIDNTPLLLEKNLDADCDVIIFVKAPEPLRRQRVLKSRGWDSRELARREKNQLPLDNKEHRADYIIVNDSDADSCFEQVRRIFSQIPQKPI